MPPPFSPLLASLSPTSILYFTTFPKPSLLTLLHYSLPLTLTTTFPDPLLTPLSILCLTTSTVFLYLLTHSPFTLFSKPLLTPTTTLLLTSILCFATSTPFSLYVHSLLSSPILTPWPTPRLRAHLSLYSTRIARKHTARLLINPKTLPSSLFLTAGSHAGINTGPFTADINVYINTDPFRVLFYVPKRFHPTPFSFLPLSPLVRLNANAFTPL